MEQCDRDRNENQWRCGMETMGTRVEMRISRDMAEGEGILVGIDRCLELVSC